MAKTAGKAVHQQLTHEQPVNRGGAGALLGAVAGAAVGMLADVAFTEVEVGMTQAKGVAEHALAGGSGFANGVVDMAIKQEVADEWSAMKAWLPTMAAAGALAGAYVAVKYPSIAKYVGSFFHHEPAAAAPAPAAAQAPSVLRP
jgi:hypothetical protein